MTIARLAFYRWQSTAGGQPSPDDTVEVEVGVAAFDLEDGHAVWIDAPLLDEDLGTGRTWNLADVLERFRPNRVAVAYGDAYTEMAGSLGLQPLAWSRTYDPDPAATAAIEAVGTDCRDPKDYIRRRTW